MSLFFIKMLVNPLNLIKLSAKHGHFSASHPTMNLDQGYLVHRLLSSLFDQLVPKSFFHQVNRQYHAIEILFYHENSLNQLLERVDQKIALQMITHDPQLEQLNIAKSCVMKESEDKDLSHVEWGNLVKIAMSTLVVPVSRTTDVQNKIREIDAYLLYKLKNQSQDDQPQDDQPQDDQSQDDQSQDDQSQDDQPQDDQSQDEVQVAQMKEHKSRYEVYVEWFKKQIDSREVCSCEFAKIESFKLESLERKNMKSDGKKQWKSLKRPVVEVKCILKINHPEKMPSFLLNGLGRHQGFGFGMLKMIPTNSI
jgi:hypothetical protein